MPRSLIQKRIKLRTIRKNDRIIRYSISLYFIVFLHRRIVEMKCKETKLSFQNQSNFPTFCQFLLIAKKDENEKI